MAHLNSLVRSQCGASRRASRVVVQVAGAGNRARNGTLLIDAVRLIRLDILTIADY
jgi:hypothetical protein